jgi:hypothetical protein
VSDTIQRYAQMNDYVDPHPNGDYVLHADHLTALVDLANWILVREAEKDAEIAGLRAELAEARRERDRLDWYFGPALKGGDFINTYMTGIREKWTPNQWRAAIDAAREGGE